MEIKVEDFFKAEIYVKKHSKEKVKAYKGKDLIRAVFGKGEHFITFLGKEIDYTKECIDILANSKYFSPEHLEIEIGKRDVVCNKDMVVCFDDGTIDVFAYDIFTEYFEKAFGKEDIKISSKGILRATEKIYLNLNNCSSIVIDEDTIILKSGRLIPIERKEVEHFDKIKELIKNYVEE